MLLQKVHISSFSFPNSQHVKKWKRCLNLVKSSKKRSKSLSLNISFAFYLWMFQRLKTEKSRNSYFFPIEDGTKVIRPSKIKSPLKRYNSLIRQLRQNWKCRLDFQLVTVSYQVMAEIPWLHEQIMSSERLPLWNFSYFPLGFVLQPIIWCFCHFECNLLPRSWLFPSGWNVLKLKKIGRKIRRKIQN